MAGKLRSRLFGFKKSDVFSYICEMDEKAEAKKEAMIREAEGQAEAIRAVQMANADGLKFLNDANPNAAVLQLKSLEAFAKAADGQATKIIIPSEIQGVAGLAKSVMEVAGK